MKVTYLKFVGGQSPWYWKLYLLIVSAVVYQMVMEYLCLSVRALGPERQVHLLRFFSCDPIQRFSLICNQLEIWNHKICFPPKDPHDVFMTPFAT